MTLPAPETELYRLMSRGGLRARALEGGTMRIGDAVTRADA